jgi:hypothetical protein
VIAFADALRYMRVMAIFKVFNGRKYRLSSGYYKAENWGSGPSSLHRAKWEHYRGPIPDGFDVHHKNGDRADNKMVNLELIERIEHMRQHVLERQARGEFRIPGALAHERAAEWHASPAGLAWHSKNGKRAWDNRVWHRLECQECGREYRSPYPTRSKFCHLNCKMTDLRRRRGKPVGVLGRRVVPVLSRKQRP